MNILKIKKLFILLICFASTSHAAVISLACADDELEFFQYYLVKMDTNKKTAEQLAAKLALEEMGAFF